MKQFHKEMDWRETHSQLDSIECFLHSNMRFFELNQMNSSSNDSLVLFNFTKIIIFHQSNQKLKEIKTNRQCNRNFQQVLVVFHKSFQHIDLLHFEVPINIDEELYSPILNIHCCERIFVVLWSTSKKICCCRFLIGFDWFGILIW